MTDETIIPFFDYLKQYGVMALSDALIFGEDNILMYAKTDSKY